LPETITHNGFAADAIYMARSATPVNLIASTVIVAGTHRPDLIFGVPVYIEDPAAPGGRRFNRAAFAIPVSRVIRRMEKESCF
jgi:hypothetical protein